MNSTCELELKLMLPDRVTGHRIIDALAGMGGTLTAHGEAIQNDVYLDTASRRLKQSGYAYRIRCIGHRRIATLKQAKPDDSAGGGVQQREASGVSHRLEIEASVPDRAVLPSEGSPLSDFLAPLLGPEQLIPLFTVVTRREVWSLSMPDPEITAKVAVDETHFEYPDDRVSDPHHELEIEWSGPGAGNPGALELLSRRIRRMFHVEPGRLSKYERGCLNS
ncbi:MAG TPA: CYTH domain-containing protein [bacterium]|nr:CYTH domain-containing protein [bacterium]